MVNTVFTLISVTAGLWDGHHHWLRTPWLSPSLSHPDGPDSPCRCSWWSGLGGGLSIF